MRLRRNRIIQLYLYKMKTVKDSEGGTYDVYGLPESFNGIAWPTGEELQQKLYGAVQNDAYSIKVDGKYERLRDGDRICYKLENGVVISPLDGISLHEPGKNPEYEIRISRPYEHLQLEVTKIDRKFRQP